MHTHEQTSERIIPLREIQLFATGLIGPEGPSALPDGSLAFVAQGTQAALSGELRLVRPDGSVVTLLSSALGVHGTAHDRARGALYLIKFDVDRSPIKTWAGRGGDALGAGVFRVALDAPHAVAPLYKTLDDRPLAGPLAAVVDDWDDLWITNGFFGAGSLLWGDAAGTKLVCVVPSVPDANSIALSPDRRTLYLASEKKLMAFQISGRGTLLSEGGIPKRHVLAEFAPDERPDGIAVEGNGSILVGCWDGGIMRFGADGTLLGRTRIEGHGVVNLAFGGADWRTLYLAVNESGKNPDTAPGKIASIHWPESGLKLL